MSKEGKNKKERPKTIVLYKNPMTKIGFFKRMGDDFVVSTTSRSVKIFNEKDNLIYIYGGNDYTMKEFHLQRKLKKVVRDQIALNQIVVPNLTEQDIRYKVYSDRVLGMGKEEIIEDAIEYDINKAYYQCARNLGYLSEEMFLECLDLPKHKRLRFLGSIATSKRKYTYTNGKLSEEGFEVIEDELLRAVWFHICKVVDDCLFEFSEALGDKFLLYYVDGIYMIEHKDSGEIETLNNISKSYGFEFSEAPVKSIRKVSKGVGNGEYQTLMITKVTDEGFKEKPFYLSKNEIFKSENNDYKNVLNAQKN
jgi:hypothetical protein